MPRLIYADLFAKNGIPGLLTPEGYAISWTQYQGAMIKRLNALTQGMEEERQTVKAIILANARSPTTASTFNHASMAHNNHLFFGSLSHLPKPLTDYQKLHDSLVATFGSIETLRRTMLDTASGMFGPGFVWLVWARGVGGPGAAGARPSRNAWRILTTYLAGTPYPEAGFRQQDKDMNTTRQDMNSVGSFGRDSRMARLEAAKPPGTAYVDPVLCVNTWEHVWLRDYGIEGKRAYLERWWDSIDWNEVNNRVPDEVKNQAARSQGFQSQFLQ